MDRLDQSDPEHSFYACVGQLRIEKNYFMTHEEGIKENQKILRSLVLWKDPNYSGQCFFFSSVNPDLPSHPTSKSCIFFFCLRITC